MVDRESTSHNSFEYKQEKSAKQALGEKRTRYLYMIEDTIPYCFSGGGANVHISMGYIAI